MGSRAGDRVQIWLANHDGELVPTMWPGEYRARLRPLELLDQSGRVLARGGETIHVGGGFLPANDPRQADHPGLFSASGDMSDPRSMKASD